MQRNHKMSLQFLNLPKILGKLNVEYISTQYGSYGVFADSPDFAKKLRKHKLWIALNEKNELVVAKDLRDCGNKWLDEIAYIKDNDEAKWNELIDKANLEELRKGE